MTTSLILGDCAEKMRDLPANSIDAIVTDPPYGLAFMGAKWDNFGGKSCGNDSIEERRRKAKEYRESHKGCGNYPNSHSSSPTQADMMNFQDAMTPIFAEALRVAKPGAHLLAFGGTRTYHRLACAIEDAGWEVRDCCMWIHSQGFPKGQNVAKQVEALLKRKEFIPETDEAKAWEGWNTQLKPACEPIVVARKPLDGTVAANVLKHGTGALNIDACRVPVRADDDVFAKNPHTRSKGTDAYNQNCYGKYKPMERDYDPTVGRFPANLIHDGSDEVLALFPDSKGSGKARTLHRSAKPDQEGWGMNKQAADIAELRDAGSGSAARFFYCAKASRSERGAFNDHLTIKPLALMRYLVRLVCRKGGVVLDPFMGSGTTGVAALQEGMNFIGIEREPHYMEIAERRISAVKPDQSAEIQKELPL